MFGASRRDVNENSKLGLLGILTFLRAVILFSEDSKNGLLMNIYNIILKSHVEILTVSYIR